MSVSKARADLVEQITLDVEFDQAAKAFADDLLSNQYSLKVVDLNRLLRLREQFLAARKLQRMK
jgi:hypothetical protein